jgi:hypothetical protein
MKQDLKNATIKFKDGGSNSIEVKIGDGNLTYKESRPIQYELDKGRLDTVREGDEVPVDVSLGFNWEWIKSDGSELATPVEVLKKEGAASAWVTSSSDACEPYCVDLEVTLAPRCSDGTKGEVILLSDFRYEDLSFDLKAGQISCSGKCNITKATTTRSTIAS